MNLRTNSAGKINRRVVLRFIGGTILLILLIVISIVMINEKRMADERNNKAQDPISEVLDDDEVIDETPVTEQQIIEHVVAKDKPRYLSIPKINVSKSRVVEVGTKSNGQLGSPANISDAGWYRKSSKPGFGGVLLMDGHNGGTKRDGIFDNLHTLKVDDEIIIQRGDDALYIYKVVENNVIPLEEADKYMSAMLNESIVPGKEGLNIITCVGEWNENLKTYNKRVMLRAVLAD